MPSHQKHHGCCPIRNEHRIRQAPRTTEVEAQTDNHKEITQKSRQYRRTDNRMVFFHPKQIHSGAQRESSGGQRDSAQDIHTNPHSPRVVIRQVRCRRQSLRKPDESYRYSDAKNKRGNYIKRSDELFEILFEGHPHK